MQQLKQRIIHLVAWTAGVRPLAHFYWWLAMRLLKALGIGTGSGVGNSGEVAVLRAISRRSNKPLVVLDVGGNVGDFTALVLAEFGSRTGRVAIFEPSPVNIGKLNERFKGAPHVTVVPKAVGAEPGRLTLHFDYAGSGMASLIDRDIRHLGRELSQSVEVEVATLKDFCAAAGIDQVDLLKIDVEGAEFEVLRGAADLLKERRIQAVLFEFGGANIDSKRFLREFWYLLAPAGYSLYRVNPAGVLLPITRYYEDLEQFQCSNYLFTSTPVDR
jgi:FkbM family methyltransferase